MNSNALDTNNGAVTVRTAICAMGLRSNMLPSSTEKKNGID